MDSGRCGSTRSNERQESVYPCRNTRGTPSPFPCSTYCSLIPLGSLTDRTVGFMARVSLARASALPLVVEGSAASDANSAAPSAAKKSALLEDMARLRCGWGGIDRSASRRGLERDIPEAQHFRYAAGCSVIEARLGGEVLRVVKCAEEDVEDRQIGEIAVMPAACVMARVALRALHDVAQPAGRADVAVLEDRQQRRREQDDGGSFRRDADDQCQAETGQHGPPDHVGGTEPERAIGVQPLGAMMQLME